MKTNTLKTESNIVPLPKQKQRSQWVKTRYSNLVRSRGSGKFFARAKVCGKSICQSLDTASLEIAKTKLDKLLTEERERLTKKPDEALTVADLVKEVLLKTESDADLKPSSKLYRRETWDAIQRIDPEFGAVLVVKLDSRRLATLCDKLREKYSATRFNGILTTIRMVLKIARLRGLLIGDPSDGIDRASVPLNQPDMPSSEKFGELLAFLQSDPKRKLSSRLIRFLAYSGCRISAAIAMRPENIDLAAGVVTLPKVKYDEIPARVPMIKELRELCLELIQDYPGDGPLIPIKSPKRTLQTACRELGIAHMTPHTFRHLFATRCLESGVDIRCTAAWLGHKDGGKLLLARYAHLRNEHSQAMAQKVSFSTGKPESPALPLVDV